MPGLIWVRDRVVGDVMVDGSVRGSDSGRSIFVGPPPGGGSRSTCGSWPKRGSHRGVVGVTERDLARWSAGGDGFEGGGAELAQDVEGAPRELARDRQRRARVAESAGLEREVVGVVGAAGPAR